MGPLGSQSRTRTGTQDKIIRAKREGTRKTQSTHWMMLPTIHMV